MSSLLDWFKEARYGLFLHWGPYSAIGRGEQVLYREHLDQQDYARQACAWNPQHMDAAAWADAAVRGGFRYACLTTRHHDGYCLWDSALTDYTSVRQAPKRDFVAEYVTAFRSAGLRVGLYYSLGDWRLPAFYTGPEQDPEGWAAVKAYIFGQVRELLTNYGKIDQLWFDAAWPRTEEDLDSRSLLEMIRSLQPDILVNNRLGKSSRPSASADGGEGAGESSTLGDFGTPEHQIRPDPNRAWESCQTTTWRLWCHSRGERWRSSAQLLDMLCECAERGGNLLLNVGPDGEGRMPEEFLVRNSEIGRWLALHGGSVFQTTGGDLVEFVTRGRITIRDNSIYLIIRFWDGQPEMRIADLVGDLRRATLLTTGQELSFSQDATAITLRGLPSESPSRLFPVIRLDFASPPSTTTWGQERLWSGDPLRIAKWAATRGSTPWVDGQLRQSISTTSTL